MKLHEKTRKLVRRVPVLMAGDDPARDDTAESTQPPFAGSRLYWEERYASGGNSGRGSYNRFAEFKAEVLNQFVIANGIESVIEFGCGDGNQLMLARYPRYLGFDISPTAIEICQGKFVADNNKSFKLLNQYFGESADLALSLDVIYHLIEDAEFERHMSFIFNSANRFVIIYSSNTDRNKHKDSHVKHRKFTRWIKANAADWILARHIPNRYPYEGDHKKGSFADFYIYQKVSSSRRHQVSLPPHADKFDILIVGDFRFPGGTSGAVAHELRALRSTSYSVGLYHVNSAYLGRKLVGWHQEIVAEIERGAVTVVPEGAAAEAGVIFVHSPWVLRKMAPTRLWAPLRILVTHHPPLDARGRLYYDPRAVERSARRAFSGGLVWAPISPVCRHACDLARLPFPRLRMDWTNLLLVDDWGTARDGLIGARPVIGRHSRPRKEKWPATREALFQVYPNEGEVEVRLMGLARDTKAIVGEYPSNWRTMEVDEVPVPEFLRAIDFFVYFHHPHWVEAYGRTVAEAAAAGCVVILPPYLKRTFGDAGLYCEPAEVLALVRSIAADRERFAALSARAREIIDQRFGPRSYLDRLERVLAAARSDIPLDEIVERPRLPVPAILHGEAKRASFYWEQASLGIAKMRPKRALKRQVKRFRRQLLD